MSITNYTILIIVFSHYGPAGTLMCSSMDGRRVEPSLILACTCSAALLTSCHYGFSGYLVLFRRFLGLT